MSGTSGADEICTLRIELRDTDPLIWREIEVATAITLRDLHAVIQAAMGWSDQHLWEFTIGRRRFGVPMKDDWGTEPCLPAAKVRLHEVLTPRKTTMTYLYDFGDSWEHRLILSGRRQGEAGIAYPRYIAGEGNAPPEDCGGIPGFYNTLDIAADPAHPDHDEVVEWLDGYDPKTVDEARIRTALARIARRRGTGARPAKRAR